MENIHKHSSFKHSCIHPPRHPKSRQPSPQFERLLQHRRRRTGGGHSSRDEVLQSDQGDFVHELDNKVRHRGGDVYNGLNEDSDDGEEEDDDLFNTKPNLLDDLERENYRFRSMSDFYDSIPDYNDLHHLSESEFYSRLERLKIQQQELMDLVVGTSQTKKISEQVPSINNKTEVKEFYKGPTREQDVIIPEEDCNSINSNTCGEEKNSKDIPIRPASSTGKTKKSVRISSGTTYRTDFSDLYDYDEFVDERLRLNVASTNPRSKSASPRRTRSLTVPKPFKMTQREEEEKMLEDMTNSKKYLSKISLNFDDNQLDKCRPKIKPFKANPVPLTSRIPLYEHIKEDHRRKSTLAKLNSAIELQSQIKPFRFNGDKSSSRCLSRATSTPNLDASIDQKPGSFKANPCPKNMFSNYFYNKMWEDEYFRALNRKIRAEEMLKISSLPPSMAKRNEGFLADLDMVSRVHKSRRRKRKCKKSSKERHYEFKDKEKSLQKNNSISSKRSNSSIVSSSCETTPIPSYPVNRPNLAATLRVQSARQKVRELSKPKSLVPENKLTARTSSTRSQSRDGWGVKKSPAWRSMNYDPSNMEDLAIRLATRRAEQKLRQEEHEISMELMKQRVRAAPLLLEGPTYWGPKVGQLTHQCRSSEDVSCTTAKHQSRHLKKGQPSRYTNNSKLSFYSADTDQQVTTGKE